MKFFLLIPLFALLFSSCQTKEEIEGSGNMVSEERNVSNFTRISFSGSGNLFITQGSDESIKIEGEDNIIPYLATEVNGDHLQIHFKNFNSIKNFKTTKPLNIYVKVKNIQEIHLSGTGTISSKNLDIDTLKISVSGSGNVDVDVKGRKIVSVLSGSGGFHVNGTVDSQDIWISGSGIYEGFSLESKNANVKISGAGKVFVNVLESLDVRISGNGVVTYMGNPKINQTIAGSGKIEKHK